MLLELILGIVVFILAFTLLDRPPKGLPPGKWGWPIIGYFPPSGTTVGDMAEKFQKKYGDIFKWRLGSRTMIFLNNYRLVKLAFSKPELQERPDMYTFDVFTSMKKTGISNANGLLWQHNRRFALRHLRDQGLGKSSLEDIILFEAECLVEDFAKHTGKLTVLPWSLHVAILNIIWKLTADKRYNVHDKEIQEFEKMIYSLFFDSQGAINLLDIFPWVVDILPSFILRRVGLDEFLKKCDRVMDFMMDVINEHKATLKPESPRDYIDNHLIEMEVQKDNPSLDMDLLNLVACTADLFFAGSETTTSTTKWIIVYLLKFPDVQARIQKEIDDNVPSDRLPSLRDKPNLPYTEAVIHEVIRLQTIAPMGLPHSSSEDTELAGYKIPKGTVIMANLEACHKDPEYWQKPNDFYPEHFLDEDGNFNNKREGFLAFSTGRRACIGESLAKMNLFLFLTALLQNFSFTAPEGELPSTARDPSMPLFSIPKVFSVIINKRK